MLKIILTLSSIWLVMATVGNATNDPILDTSGNPVQRGVEYYIKPAVTDNGGPFTLVERNNGSCPLYVGQENLSSGGIPVTFSPHLEGEDVVRESKNANISFSGASTCAQSTAWKVSNETDPMTQSRLILTGDDAGYFNYFHVYKGPEVLNASLYALRWCPATLCPYCRFNCAFIDVVIENGKRLLTLNDTSALPVVFERA